MSKAMGKNVVGQHAPAKAAGTPPIAAHERKPMK